MHNKKSYIFIVAGVFLILGAVYFLVWKQQKNTVVFTMKEETLKCQEEVTSDSQYDAQNLKAEESMIYVYVCGYVNAPGVYALSQEARMYEAVEMAGGIREGGCAEYLEMASVLSDGMRIYVPSVEEAVAAESRNEEDNGLINLNAASKEQLMTLPGIGEAKADAILQYREDYGGFGAVEDVMNVPGIKEAAFSKIKKYICVDS